MTGPAPGASPVPAAGPVPAASSRPPDRRRTISGIFRRGTAASAGAPGQREAFRLGAPVAIWWIWLVFAMVNLVDLGLQASPRFAIVVAAILVTITGVAYACAQWPRVIADEAGLTVLNPVREYRVPWSAVRDVDVRDWVRIDCATTPGGDTTKTVESWALFATARVKRNYTQRALTYVANSADTARMPDEAKRLMSQPTVVIIARRLEQRARSEQARGAPDGALQATWAWPSIAAMAVPALALLIVLLS